jgi:hypothetical protein
VAVHVFRYKDSDIFALTYDRSGGNLPTPRAGVWSFIETLDPVRFAWGEENFGEAFAHLDLDGYFLFEGEMVPQPPT